MTFIHHECTTKAARGDAMRGRRGGQRRSHDCSAGCLPARCRVNGRTIAKSIPVHCASTEGENGVSPGPLRSKRISAFRIVILGLGDSRMARRDNSVRIRVVLFLESLAFLRNRTIVRMLTEIRLAIFHGFMV